MVCRIIEDHMVRALVHGPIIAHKQIMLKLKSTQLRTKNWIDQIAPLSQTALIILQLDSPLLCEHWTVNSEHVLHLKYIPFKSILKNSIFIINTITIRFGFIVFWLGRWPLVGCGEKRGNWSSLKIGNGHWVTTVASKSHYPANVLYHQATIRHHHHWVVIVW